MWDNLDIFGSSLTLECDLGCFEFVCVIYLCGVFPLLTASLVWKDFSIF